MEHHASKDKVFSSIMASWLFTRVPAPENGVDKLYCFGMKLLDFKTKR